MKVNADMYSVHSSELNDEQLYEKRKKERIGTVIAIISQLLWAVNAIQLKSYKSSFPEQYTINNLILWRSIPIGIIGYIACKKKNIRIVPQSEIQNKFWFYTRSVGNYICVMSWIIFLLYFRVSTCQCVNSCSPLLLIYLSIIILHENFFMRYLYGVILCIIGTWIILLNEKKNVPTDKDNDKSYSASFLLMGILSGLFYLIIVTFNVFAMKVIAKENIGGEIQNFYLGVYNSGIALLGVIIFEHNFGFSNILYVLYSASNGIVFYSANYLQAVALQHLSMVKFVPSTYIRIIFTYILGFILFGEKVYFTDVVGSIFIIGFQIYNTLYPVGKQVDENVIEREVDLNKSEELITVPDLKENSK